MIYNKHVLNQNFHTALTAVSFCIVADRFNSTCCLWSLPGAWLAKCPHQPPVSTDLPSMRALQGHRSVANLPECTLFPAWIPDTKHTPGTQSKHRQSEILNCPWDSTCRATDWQKPQRGVSKANILYAVIGSELELFAGISLCCFPYGNY